MQAYVVKQISTSVQFLHRVVVHPHLLETRPLFTTYFNEKGEHGFLLRDAMHNADYACLSVTCWYSVKTVTHILKLFTVG